MNSDRETDFIRQQGLSYLAHLLRRISGELVAGVDEWSKQAGLLSTARTRSTLMALSAHGVISIMEFATLIRQTHPAVVTSGRLLSEAGMVAQERDAKDCKRTLLRFTKEGEAEPNVSLI